MASTTSRFRRSLRPDVVGVGTPRSYREECPGVVVHVQPIAHVLTVTVHGDRTAVSAWRMVAESVSGNWYGP